MQFTRDDARALACPVCRGALELHGELAENLAIDTGFVDCTKCGRSWPVRGGLPELLDERQVHGTDRWLRGIYDFIAPTHDLGVMFALPLMQFPDPGASRNRYMERIDLRSLHARPGGPPLRILEVGVGSGGNLPLVERDLPADLAVEIWGLDISRAMLHECHRRLGFYTGRPVHLLLGDAHSLPFPDGTFDRVFHVGGINGYRSPQRALAEMARVARADTPVVVVDEQLDPNRSHWPHHHVLFWALTWFDPYPEPPVKHLPTNATAVEVSRVSRFYYCLTFRMPAVPASSRPPEERDRTFSTTTEGDTTMSNGALISNVKAILTQQNIDDLANKYSQTTMDVMLGKLFLDAYPTTQPWAQALEGAFGSPSLPADDAPPGRAKLSLRDRERCIIALLASRGGGLNLALHIYIALMNKITAEEIAHILFLAGVYTGVDNFAKGLKDELRTLTLLKDRLTKSQPLDTVAIVVALQGAFIS
jgi:ubiquinone/menaquinone biosynthesis C-methylase UbiE/alkylhydroperoxidase/carboxymuconolactone decarboxylase family protein YurZ/uncharacterized protein YbaR (Trm112 family)